MATVTGTQPPAAPTPPAGGGTWTPADPGPLGLAGFGITTFVLSMINANLVREGATPVVLGLAFAYGGLAQLLAGMWEFRRGNTFGAVAFTSYGAFWISFFIPRDLRREADPADRDDRARSACICGHGGSSPTYMFFCSFTRSRAVSAVFFALAVTFILLGIGRSGGDVSIVHAGGWAGLVTAAVALYTSCAEVMFSAYGRWVLPVGPPAPREGPTV